MHQPVIDAFLDFTIPLEGKVSSMYLDVKGLVTTGIGNLVDPITLALGLPWKLPDGSPASQNQVAAEWRTLKAHQELSKLHWKYAARLTTVRLDSDGIQELVTRQLLSNERIMKAAFPDWDSWPADAQLAACSMAWACGAGFPAKFGNFTRAANAGDWTAARASCDIRTKDNPGIVPRNAHNRLCLGNAAAVSLYKFPSEVLYWPRVAPSGPHAEEDGNPTWEELRRAVKVLEPTPWDTFSDLRSDPPEE